MLPNPYQQTSGYLKKDEETKNRNMVGVGKGEFFLSAKEILFVNSPRNKPSRKCADNLCVAKHG